MQWTIAWTISLSVISWADFPSIYYYLKILLDYLDFGRFSYLCTQTGTYCHIVYYRLNFRMIFMYIGQTHHLVLLARCQKLTALIYMTAIYFLKIHHYSLHYRTLKSPFRNKIFLKICPKENCELFTDIYRSNILFCVLVIVKVAIFR